MEDAQIIDLYWSREERAIRETQTKYGKRLTALARNILDNPSDCEEVVSDAYFRAWNSIPPNRPDSLPAYLYKIVRRAAIDRFRRNRSGKRRRSEYDASLDELAECIADGETPEDLLHLQELAAAIQRYLHTLPEEQRNIFLQRYYFLDPLKKIAGYYGCREGKIKTILYRVRFGLKNHLEQEGYLR